MKYVARFVHITDGGSHPTRVRGLKFFKRRMRSMIQMSHPTRVRGLKFFKVFTIIR